MSNLSDFARSELARAFPPDRTDSMQAHINRDIMELVDLFCKQDHSGLSAEYALRMLYRLLNWKPIRPLTGEEDEWRDCFDNTQQNIRCGSVFRDNHDNSTARDIDGKIFSKDGGETWYSNQDSSVPVTFPYLPPVQPEKVFIE